jgi:hypothetical protein
MIFLIINFKNYQSNFYSVHVNAYKIVLSSNEYEIGKDY